MRKAIITIIMFGTNMHCECSKGVFVFVLCGDRSSSSSSSSGAPITRHHIDTRAQSNPICTRLLFLVYSPEGDEKYFFFLFLFCGAGFLTASSVDTSNVLSEVIFICDALPCTNIAELQNSISIHFIQCYVQMMRLLFSAVYSYLLNDTSQAQ